MNVLIIEDEQPAARRLKKMVSKLRPEFRFLDIIDSVETAVSWFRNHPPPDLVFMDIQLADGVSFSIFSEIRIEVPVIFTTAYDQYMLKAFKVNSVDYLLKPIEIDELEAALVQFERHHLKEPVLTTDAIRRIVAEASVGQHYKERFMMRIGEQILYVPVREIAYGYSESGSVFLMRRDGKRFLVDYTLEQLSGLLDPKLFFRINRKMVIRLEAIRKIHTWFNSRLKLELDPALGQEVIVSRDRVGDFKKWLDQ